LREPLRKSERFLGNALAVLIRIYYAAVWKWRLI